MSREPILQNAELCEEEDRNLRPKRMADMVGQREVAARLTIALNASRKRGETLGHILFDGPPGLGKTTFATVIPHELGVPLQIASGATLTYDATLGNSFGGAYELFRGSNAAIKLAWSHGWMFKEADAPTQGWEVYANRQQFHNDEGITLIADATQLASQGKLKEGVGLPRTSLYYGLEAFFKSIQDGEPVACTADQAARSTVVGILAHQAITTGKRVEITKEALGS